MLQVERGQYTIVLSTSLETLKNGALCSHMSTTCGEAKVSFWHQLLQIHDNFSNGYINYVAQYTLIIISKMHSLTCGSISFKCVYHVCVDPFKFHETQQEDNIVVFR